MAVPARRRMRVHKKRFPAGEPGRNEPGIFRDPVWNIPHDLTVTKRGRHAGEAEFYGVRAPTVRSCRDPA